MPAPFLKGPCVNIHDRLTAFWAGERPDVFPYTIYWWEWRKAADDPAWDAMYEDGLGVTWHMAPYCSHVPGLETFEEEIVIDGVPGVRQVRRTPIGEIDTTLAAGWRRKYWLETTDDYRVMTWIARHTQLEPDYEGWRTRAKDLPSFGVPLSFIGRTPLQEILVDYAGLEQFSIHLFELEEPVCALYEALLVNFRRRTELVADGPGRFVSCLENFTAESLGHRRYEEWLLPVYEECFPALQQAGKVVGTHYDGRTASCRKLIARAPIDLIESLTEPPEGDQTLPECREVWPDKLFWCNIRIGDYQLPDDELREKVRIMCRDASPDGARLAFEVSEELPADWRRSMPVVMQALREASSD